MREYSKFRPIEHISFKSFQCLLESSLIIEYSRMHVPSLSSGCEIAPFFVRHNGSRVCLNFQDAGVSNSIRIRNDDVSFEALFKGVRTQFGLLTNH